MSPSADEVLSAQLRQRGRRRRRRTLALSVSCLLAGTAVAGGFLLAGPAIPDQVEETRLLPMVTDLVTDRRSGGPDPARLDDGDLDGGTLSIADSRHPATTRLDPELRAAVAAAARDALADDQIDVRITSGWRSADYQQRLLDEAVAEYGSYREARRWVNTPEDSTHVTGDAVDVGPTDAAYWMATYGSNYGLCQTYANEIWHYELSVAPGERCPTPR